jgi:hypothetical protein
VRKSGHRKREEGRPLTPIRKSDRILWQRAAGVCFSAPLSNFDFSGAQGEERRGEEGGGREN